MCEKKVRISKERIGEEAYEGVCMHECIMVIATRAAA